MAIVNQGKNRYQSVDIISYPHANMVFAGSTNSDTFFDCTKFSCVDDPSVVLHWVWIGSIDNAFI